MVTAARSKPAQGHQRDLASEVRLRGPHQVCPPREPARVLEDGAAAARVSEARDGASRLECEVGEPRQAYNLRSYPYLQLRRAPERFGAVACGVALRVHRVSLGRACAVELRSRSRQLP